MRNFLDNEYTNLKFKILKVLLNNFKLFISKHILYYLKEK
jgi:hypothetical protein